MRFYFDYYKGIPSQTSLIITIERFTPLNFLAAFAHFEDLVPANTSVNIYLKENGAYKICILPLQCLSDCFD